MDKDLLMIGSVPLETAPEVLETCGRALGEHLPCIPDGETGDRIIWTTLLAYRVFNGHPEIETILRPKPENGVEYFKPRNREDSWRFKVKEGVDQVRFGDPGWRLGYAKDAINSYFVFRAIRDKGELPADIRFQVSVPPPNSAVDLWFDDPADVARVKPGFEEALRAEIAKICEKIPHQDLAIQWDACIETLDVEGLHRPSQSKVSLPERIERNIGQFERLSPTIPESVMLGYHFCYGTLGGWPIMAPKDLSATVALSNEVVARSGRRVDFIHIPILPTTEESYFAPLSDLKPGGASTYFGVIHNMDDLTGFRERLALIKKYFKEDFGLAGYCGFGRHSAEEVPQILQEHLDASKILSEAS